MDPVELAEFQRFISTATLPALGPEPRPGIKSVPELNAQLERFLQARNLPRALAQPLRAAALLWHDHLDESHQVSQNLPGPTGSFLHGIMHRREPDYENAKYWFRRVGAHPAFAELARKAKALTASDPGQAPLLARIGQGESWDPFAFIDVCAEYAGRPATDPQRRFLERVQAAEFTALLSTL
jgi:hypothetical protein